MLVDLSPIGGEGSVNPEYVTSVEEVSFNGGSYVTTLWVTGRAGYGTYSRNVVVSTYQAQLYLNDPDGYIRERVRWTLDKSIDDILMECKGLKMSGKRRRGLVSITEQLRGARALLQSSSVGKIHDAL